MKDTRGEILDRAEIPLLARLATRIEKSEDTVLDVAAHEGVDTGTLRVSHDAV